MKKRFLSILLILCMVLCLAPTAALAADTVKEVASADELTAAVADSTVDTVRLAADIDISASLTVSRKVTLDLNGKNLHFLSENATGSVIVVPTGGDLTVTDSSATDEKPAGTGKISGGNGTPHSPVDRGSGTPRHGGGILVDGGTVNVMAGNIADNSAELGGGVAVMSGAFHMSGGTIDKCSVSSTYFGPGGGVLNYSTGEVTLSGTAAILNCYSDGNGSAISSFGEMTIRDDVVIKDCSENGRYGDGKVIICKTVLTDKKIEISGGEFHGEIYLWGGSSTAENWPTISGGTFYDYVKLDGANITNGTFHAQVDNYGGTVSGGLFKGVFRDAGDSGIQPIISGGTFMEKVYIGCDIPAEYMIPYISGGLFYGGIEKLWSVMGEIRGHSVLFMVDGKEHARQVLSGDAVTVQPIDPAEKKHYIFDGWYNGETKFTFGSKVSSDITLTAGWNEIPAFQLRINEDTDEWEYSHDYGETWTSFGVKASGGEKGDKGDKGDPGAQGEKGDTGAPGADGKDGNTPYIGSNGNWWIGDIDTGVNATGNKGEKGDKGNPGEKGEKGDTGAPGSDGKDGKDGATPILKIGSDNLWYVSYDSGTTWTSLGVKATGDKGASGTDGKDGETPRIGDNGNWWIGDIDIGVNATGNKGEKGEKGDTGAPGSDGKDGKDGVTPILKIGSDNLWYVSYDSGTTWTSLGVKATGDKGESGTDGKDGIGIAKAEINTNGELVLTYTDGNTVNVGRVVGADGKDGQDASAVKANAGTEAKTDISPAMVIIGAVAGVSFLGNLALLLCLVLRKKNHSI